MPNNNVRKRNARTRADTAANSSQEEAMAAVYAAGPQIPQPRRLPPPREVNVVPLTTRITASQKQNKAQAHKFTSDLEKHIEKTVTKHMRKPHLHLSRSARKYALALERPWEASEVGIPSLPAFPSAKLTAFAKGTFATQTGGVNAGIGWIAARPRNGMWNDKDCLFRTGSGTTVSTITGSGSLTGASNSPYAASAFGSGPTQLTGRVVACGLRVRYISTELNLGGDLQLLESPSHASLSGATGTTMLSLRTCRREAIRDSRKWHGIVYHPVSADELAYSSDTTDDALELGIWVNAPDSTVSISFEYEYWCCFEVIGANASDRYSPSDADAAGVSAVVDITNSGSFWNYARDVTGSIASNTLLMAIGNLGPQTLSWVGSAAASAAHAYQNRRGQYAV